MHIAHSNFISVEPEKRSMRVVAKEKPLNKKQEFARDMAYKGYKKALKDHAEDIEEIRKYFPGWTPTFEY